MDFKSSIKKAAQMGYKVEIRFDIKRIEIKISKRFDAFPWQNVKHIEWENHLTIEEALESLVNETEQRYRQSVPNNAEVPQGDYSYHHKGFWDKPKVGHTPEKEWYEERGNLKSKEVEDDSMVGKVDPELSPLPWVKGIEMEIGKEKPFEEYPTGCPPESHNQTVRELGICYQCGRDWFI